MQALGRQAGQTIGDENVGSPVAVAEAVGGAVLTHAEHIAGSRHETREGVGVACDSDVGVGPGGGGSGLDADLIVGAGA